PPPRRPPPSSSPPPPRGPPPRAPPPLQRGRVDLGQWLAPPAADHHVQPGQRRLPDQRAVVHRDAVQRRPQDLLHAQPDRGGVPVAGQEDQAGHVPAVYRAGQEQPGLRALPQPPPRGGAFGQLLRADLEQLLARVAPQDLDQVVAVVGVR